MANNSNPKKTDANRGNAQRSTGPKDTTSTRLNATTHGLLAQGLTELDDPDFHQLLVQRLTTTYQPIGDLECFLVERLAFHVTRLKRAGRLEAEYIAGEIHPPVLGPSLDEILGPEIIDSGVPAALGALSAVNLVAGFQRYETAIENKLYRAINQLERLQRMRRGEYVPAPQALDVSVHSEPENIG
jgi:hypothetical protein